MTSLARAHKSRVRLRPAYSDEELTAIYSTPWQQDPDFKDHELRIASTIAVARWLMDDVSIITDLSCGDGRITDALQDGTKMIQLGDYAPGYEFTGPIEKTIDEVEWADLFICSETLEHLDDPDSVLRKIRQKTRYLVASSPIGEWDPSHNPEHYWGWGLEAFEEMLNDAGFEKVLLAVIETPPPYLYDYQIWGCR
jgi:hypothetical protein